MSAIVICQRCGLNVPTGLQHESYDICFQAMKERLGRINKCLSFGAFKVARCRSKNHGGKPKIPKLDICIDCLGAGYGSFQTARDISYADLGDPKPEGVSEAKP